MLETERLVLRELEDGDAAFLVALLNSEGFLRHIGDRQVRTHEDALRYLAEGPRASYLAHGFGLWRVELRATGEPVGLSGLLRRDTLPCPDLGYAFLPGAIGCGYATEAGAAVMHFAFGTLGLTRVLAIVSPGNNASVHVLEKLGFNAEGTQEIGGQALRIFAATPPDRHGRQ